MLRKTFILIFLIIFSSTYCFAGANEDRRFKAGLMVALKVEEKYPVSKDEKDFLRVNNIGLRIVSQIKGLKYAYTFSVIKIEDANAFALPGGFVYITTGLLDLGLNDSEVAFVLAHEIAHNECDHMFKMKNKANLLSALMVAVEIFAMTHTSSSKDASEVQAESAARSLAYSLSGAMITSGYSREFEREADYWGKVYTAKAGYDIGGAKTALDKIDIMKEKRPDLFSSLLMTHPYILERIEEAETSAITFPKDILIEFKARKAGNFIQDYLIKEAEKYETRDKKNISMLLYRNAYFSYPNGNQADKALYKLIGNREELERKKTKFLINWNFLIKNYEKILNEYPATSLQKDVASKLRTLKQERDEVYKWYEENIHRLPETDKQAGGQVGTDMALDYYINFIEFYPESPLIPKARYFLGQKYVSAGDYDKALDQFITLLKNNSEVEWGQKAKEEIIPIIDKSTDIVLLGRLLVLDFSKEVKDKVNARLKETIPEVKELAPLEVRTKGAAVVSDDLLLTGLAQLDKFSKEFPDSEYKVLIAQRKEKLAEEMYVEARAQSLSGNWYKTVTIYRQILKYAPDSPSAEQIRQEFNRLEQLRKNEVG